MSAPTAGVKPLKPHQIAALRGLAINPSNGGSTYVSAGTLALLRRRGLVGKHKPNRRTQTTSPLTDAGRALLASLDGATLPGDRRGGTVSAARCWLCGASCPIPLDASAEPRCVDAAQCFARQVRPPGAPISAAPVGRTADENNEEERG